MTYLRLDLLLEAKGHGSLLHVLSDLGALEFADGNFDDRYFY